MSWAFFAAGAGMGWSFLLMFITDMRKLTWQVRKRESEAQKYEAESKKYNAASFAALALFGCLVLAAAFRITPVSQDTAAQLTTFCAAGAVLGVVVGVFTAFGIMGGKPPGGPR